MQAAEQMMKLYDVVYDNDVTMLEINPMVEALDSSGNKRGKLATFSLHNSWLYCLYAIVSGVHGCQNQL